MRRIVQIRELFVVYRLLVHVRFYVILSSCLHITGRERLKVLRNGLMTAISRRAAVLPIIKVNALCRVVGRVKDLMTTRDCQRVQAEADERTTPMRSQFGGRVRSAVFHHLREGERACDVVCRKALCVLIESVDIRAYGRRNIAAPRKSVGGSER